MSRGPKLAVVLALLAPVLLTAVVAIRPSSQSTELQAVAKATTEVPSTLAIPDPTTTEAPTTTPTTVLEETTTTTTWTPPTTTYVAPPTSRYIPSTTTYLPPVTRSLPPATQPPASLPVRGGSPANTFLACVRQRESGGNYATETGNGYHGAYQFLQGTWDNTARRAGRPDLVGVPAGHTSPTDQDAMAAALYAQAGPTPWAGPGC